VQVGGLRHGGVDLTRRDVPRGGLPIHPFPVALRRVDLDPASVDVLTDALVEFPGTIVFISHDPIFLARVSTRVVEVEDGRARDYHGDYEYYLWKTMQEVESIKSTPETEMPATPTMNARPAAPTSAPRARSSEKSDKSRTVERKDATKALARAERQIAKLEEDITAGEKRIQARDLELADQSLYQEHARWTVLMKEREHWAKDQSVLTSQWAGLCEEAEKLRAKLKELESV
ncbi:MAG: hypothetical protein AABY67_07720, partial [Nitrospirota bacterium]